jgi:hypothetical protein
MYMSRDKRKVLLFSVLALVLTISFSSQEVYAAFLSSFGSPGTGDGQFLNPRGIAINSTGYIYVADVNSHRVEIFNSAGIYQLQLGGCLTGGCLSGSADGEFTSPQGIAFNSTGYIYVADFYNNRVEIFNSAGIYQLQLGGCLTGGCLSGSADGEFSGPGGIAINSTDYIYVVDSGNSRVEIFNSAGTYQSQFGSPGTGNGQFTGLSDIAFDSSDNIYVVDSGNRIQKFNSAGIYISQFGSSGSGNGQFNFPYSIELDSSDNIYVTDLNNNRIQKFSSAGIYQGELGSYGTGNSQFDSPQGITFDSSGNIYVTDLGNTRVQKFSPFDTAPPTPSIPNLDVGSDSGSSNSDNITNDNTPTFTGTAEAYSTVKIFDATAQVGTGTATGGGSYTITTDVLLDGVHSITSTATNLAGTSPDSSALSVTIDTENPTGTFAIERTDSDPSLSTERTYVRTVNLDTTCSDTGSGCDLVDITGTGLDGESSGDYESISDTRAASLTEFRGLKAADATLRDKAGNTATLSDDISLDARIVGITVTDNTPYWDVDVTFDGTVENARTDDTITFDFGSPTVTGLVVAGGDSSTFTVTDSYPKISEDTANPHQSSATLVDSTATTIVDSESDTVTTDGPIVTVQPHPVTVRLTPVESAPVSDTYAVRVLADDDLPGFDNISGLSISFSESGGTPLYVATSGGVTLEDPDGFGIDSCPLCVARLSDDSEIRFDVQRAPKAIIVSLRDMGATPDTVTFEVSSGPTLEDLDESEVTPPTLTGPPDVYDVVAESQVDNTALVTISNPNGIAKIKVKDSTDNEIGVSQIQSFTSTSALVHNVVFSSDTASPIVGPSSYDNGKSFSEGIAPSAGTHLVSAQSAATLDYELSASEDIEPDSGLPSHQQTLLTLTNPSSGLGGGTQPTELIAGLAVQSISCAADSDKDAICDDWEDETPGIPFTVKTYPGGTLNTADCTYPIIPAPTASQDIYYEIDAMTGHDPIDAARTAVSSAFTSMGTNLHLIEDETNLTHVSTISVWTDTATPVAGADINDFNSIKNDKFGPSVQRPTISTQNLQLTTVTGSGITSPAARTLTISGVSVATPNAGICGGAASDDTQGRIVLNAKLTFTQSGVGVVAPVGGLTATGTSAGLNLRLQDATTQVTSTGVSTKTVQITIPFWTETSISSSTIGTISLPMTITKTSWNGAITPTTLSSSPQISSTLLDARAQVYRYMLFAHSHGGSSGAGETLGNDIVVTLGAGFGGASDGAGGTQGTQNEQSGTIMHEIGHNLNLAHGGPRYPLGLPGSPYQDSGINCKPNYPSIMTYSRQLDSYLGAGVDWVLAFSDGGLSSLDEDDLYEVPLTNSDGDIPVIIWGSPLPDLNPAAGDSTFRKGLATDDKDWNDNDDTTGADLSIDLTNIGIYGCGLPAPGDGLQTTAYFDRNDEINLDFNFRGIGSSFDGSPGDPSYLEGTSAERWQSIFDTFLFNKASSPGKATGTPTVKAGSSVPINFQLLQIDNTPNTNADNPPYQTPTPPTKGEAYASVGCSTNPSAYTKFADFNWIEKTPSNLSHLQVVYKSLKGDTNKDVCYKLKAIVEDPAQSKFVQNNLVYPSYCPTGITDLAGCFKLK